MRIFTLATLYVSLYAAAAQPLTLEAALEMAAKQNPAVLTARLRTLEREAQAASAKAGYLPQAHLVIGGAYQTNNLQGIGLAFPGFSDRLGPYRTFNARPVVTQKVLDFSLVSAIRAARAENAAAKFDAEQAREDAQAAVIAVYLQIFQAQSRLAAARARLALAAALLAQTADREKAGASSQLDLARNRQRHDAERAALVLAEQDLAVLRPALSELLGAPVTAELAEPKLTANVATGRPAAVRAAEERVNAAAHEVARQRRERWPRLTAQGDYGVLGAGPDRALSTYTVAATLTVPLWTSGRLEADQRAAAHRAAQARQEQKRLELQATRLAEQAQLQWESQRKAADAARDSAAAARQVLELARLRFESGLATAVDTVTAQAALADAEDMEIRARYDASLALARLAFAHGDVKAVLR